MSTIQKWVAGIVLAVMLTLIPTQKAVAEPQLPVITQQEQAVQPVLAKQPTVKEMIQKEFPDAPVMVAIALAESRFNPKAKNPHSSASGVFQILKGTWAHHKCEGDVFNAEDNIKCARVIYDDSGTTPWNPSKHAWGK